MAKISRDLRVRCRDENELALGTVAPPVASPLATLGGQPVASQPYQNREDLPLSVGGRRVRCRQVLAVVRFVARRSMRDFG